MKTVDVIAAVLLVIGGLNWGTVGLFNIDMVAAILGEGSALSRTVYALVGLAGLFQGLQWRSIQVRWGVRPAFA